MEIHEKIKARRKELRMSLQDVADKIGVSKMTIQRYETKAIENMGLDKLEKIASALDISPSYLMGWTDKQLNSPGISRDTESYIDHTTPEQLQELTEYIKEQGKDSMLDDLVEIVKTLPPSSYKEVEEYLLVVKLKYSLKEGE